MSQPPNITNALNQRASTRFSDLQALSQFSDTLSKTARVAHSIGEQVGEEKKRKEKVRENLQRDIDVLTGQAKQGGLQQAEFDQLQSELKKVNEQMKAEGIDEAYADFQYRSQNSQKRAAVALQQMMQDPRFAELQRQLSSPNPANHRDAQEEFDLLVQQYREEYAGQSIEGQVDFNGEEISYTGEGGDAAELAAWSVGIQAMKGDFTRKVAAERKERHKEGKNQAWAEQMGLLLNKTDGGWFSAQPYEQFQALMAQGYEQGVPDMTGTILTTLRNNLTEAQLQGDEDAIQEILNAIEFLEEVDSREGVAFAGTGTKTEGLLLDIKGKATKAKNDIQEAKFAAHQAQQEAAREAIPAQTLEAFLAWLATEEGQAATVEQRKIEAAKYRQHAENLLGVQGVFDYSDALRKLDGFLDTAAEGGVVMQEVVKATIDDLKLSIPNLNTEEDFQAAYETLQILQSKNADAGTIESLRKKIDAQRALPQQARVPIGGLAQVIAGNVDSLPEEVFGSFPIDLKASLSVIFSASGTLTAQQRMAFQGHELRVRDSMVRGKRQDVSGNPVPEYFGPGFEAIDETKLAELREFANNNPLHPLGQQIEAIVGTTDKPKTPPTVLDLNALIPNQPLGQNIDEAAFRGMYAEAVAASAVIYALNGLSTQVKVKDTSSISFVETDSETQISAEEQRAEWQSQRKQQQKMQRHNR